MVNQILEKSKQLLFKKEENILSAGFLIGTALLASAILGLFRDRLFSHYFGAEPLFSRLGLYFAADRIPSFIFNIIVVGTLTTAFIPIFSKQLKKGKSYAWELASNTLNTVLVSFAFLAVIIFVFSKPISRVVSIGSLPTSDLNFMSTLLRVMILSQLILVISSFFSSIIQSFKRFLVPAIAPVLYNLGIILFVILFAEKWGVLAPAWGMVFGACMHLVIQFYFSKGLGFKYIRIINLKDPKLREVLILMLPRVASLAANQVSLLIDTSLSIFIGASSLVVFNFAQHLQTVPVNFFGGALSQAAFPILSAESENRKNFTDIVKSSTTQIVFFVLPISILFIILRIPLVRLVFGASKFSWGATISTSYTLAFFAVSMVFQSLVYLLNRAFYALCNTRTPVVISLISIFINIILAVYFVLVKGFGIWSLSLAFSVSSFVNAILLFVFLAKVLPEFLDLAFLYYLSKIAWGSLVTAVFLYVPMKLLDKMVFDTTRTLNLVLLTWFVFGAGLFSYILVSKILNIKERTLVLNVLKKLFSYRKTPSKLISGSIGDNIS
ncbi:MAG: murein biosynthesis integral membrane protein MurJ [Patescibacteria group bacterium]|nr:murein biosynthesis integral membrane protein MurJ [Patescibacteria group bacterium]